MSSRLEIGSLLSPRHRDKAIRILSEKSGVFAAHFLTLFGLFADANQESSVLSLIRAKEKPERTPLASLLPPEFIPKVAAFELIGEPFRTILKHPTLASRFYRIPHFLQIPVKPKNSLPEILITRGDGQDVPDTIINMWFPGYRPIDQLLSESFRQGILIACTSLNYRHNPSVTDTNEAIDFCRESSEVDFVLTDKYAATKVTPRWSGSYSILSTIVGNHSHAYKMIREGNVSSTTLCRLYQHNISEAQKVLSDARILELGTSTVQTILSERCGYRSVMKIIATLGKNSSS